MDPIWILFTAIGVHDAQIEDQGLISGIAELYTEEKPRGCTLNTN
jgi:hypothetical protein